MTINAYVGKTAQKTILSHPDANFDHIQQINKATVVLIHHFVHLSEQSY